MRDGLLQDPVARHHDTQINDLARLGVGLRIGLRYAQINHLARLGVGLRLGLRYAQINDLARLGVG